MAIVAAGAIAMVALLMLVIGGAQPILGVRLWGGAIAPESGRASFRVLLAERERGFESAAAGRRIRILAWTAEGERAAWEGVTGPDGSAEASLLWEGHARLPITVRVEDDEGEILGEAELPTRLDDWGPGQSFPSKLRGRVEGELSISAALVRGVLAPPFREEAVVELREGGAALAEARIEVSAEGALLDDGKGQGDLRPKLRLSTDAEGRARFGITPSFFDVSLVVEALEGARSGRFEAKLPVLQGAIWLAPSAEDPRLRTIVSPVSRERAYLSIATAERRVFGASVELISDGRGHASGEVDLSSIFPAISHETSAILTLASSPDFQGAGTVGWPLFAPSDPFSGASHPIRDVLLFDSMPERERLEEDRRRGVARISGLILLIAAVAEAFLLLRASRAGHLIVARTEGDPALIALTPRKPAALPLILAIVLAILMFLGIGIVVFT